MCCICYNITDSANSALFICHTVGTKNMVDTETSEMSNGESDLGGTFNFIVHSSNMMRVQNIYNLIAYTQS
jgi:hypothetical protein